MQAEIIERIKRHEEERASKGLDTLDQKQYDSAALKER